jgi:hypothetical protein
LPLAPGAGALDQAAVDADHLPRDVIALDRRLVHGVADLPHDRPRHADRLTDLARGRLVDGLVTGATHGLVRRRLHGVAYSVPAFLQHGLAHRAADRVGAGSQLSPLHRHAHGVAALLQDRLAHRAADRVGHLLVRALPHRHHLGGRLALHDRLLDRHLDARHRAAHRVDARLVAGLLHRPAHRIVDRLEDGLLHRAADRVTNLLVTDLAHRPADGVGAGLQRGLAHRPADGVRPRLQVRLPDRPADGIGHVFPDGPRDRPLDRVGNLSANRAVDRPLDRVGFLADLALDDVAYVGYRPRLHDRLAHGPHAWDELRLADGLLHVLQDRLTLELILDVPATLLGHRTDSMRCTTRVTRSLRRVRDRSQPDSQGQDGGRQQFSQHRTLHFRLPTYFGAHRSRAQRLRLRPGTANSLIPFVPSRATASGRFSKFPSSLISPKRNVCLDVASLPQAARIMRTSREGNRTGREGVSGRVSRIGVTDGRWPATRRDTLFPAAEAWDSLSGIS